MRAGILSWPADGFGRLDYLAQTGQRLTDDFFVPRLLEEEIWTETNPETNRQNRHKFPSRSDKGSVASALAFRYAAFGPTLVYTHQPRWACSIAKGIIERLSPREAGYY